MPTMTKPPTQCRVHGFEMLPEHIEAVCVNCGHAFAPGEVNRTREQRDALGQVVLNSHCPLCTSPL